MSVTSYSMYPSNNIPVYTDQTTMGMWLSRSGGAIPSGATISGVTFTMTANLFTPLGGFYLRNNDLGIRLTVNSLSYSTMIQSDKPSTWVLPNAVATQFTGATFTLCLEARDASNDYPSIAPNTYIF
ncbi:hypothetical protein FACS18948_4180 [Clostridia bacterium]|nr:hypothetical protein FACS18948_4180 [Clostridia bacterium]